MTSPRYYVFFLTLIMSITMLLQSQCQGPQRKKLSDMGLPPELVTLAGKNGQLRQLHVDGPVNDFRWLNAPLKKLTIESQTYDAIRALPESIETLVLSNTALKNLDGIHELKNLKALHLLGNAALEDASALEALKGLQELVIYRSPKLQVLPCAELEGLEILKISGSFNGDDQTVNLPGFYSELSALPKLTTLHLEAPIESLPIFASNVPLKTVRLENTRLTNLDFLKDVSTLHTLILSQNNKLEDVAILAQSGKLTSLALISNRMLAWTDIPDLPELQTLTLKFSVAMKTLAGIAHFPSLIDLRLMDDELLKSQDYEHVFNGLKTLTQLQSLSLENMDAMPDLTILAALKDKLRRLKIKGSHNLPQSKFEFIGNLSGLTVLELEDCQNLADMSFAKGITLSNLTLRLNPSLTVLPELSQMASLKQVTLDRNGRLKLHGLGGFPQLTHLHLGDPDSNDPILSGLEGLPQQKMQFSCEERAALTPETHLISLDLSYNSEGLLDGVTEYRALKKLDLHNSHLDHYSAIKELDQLEELDLRGAPIKSLDFLPASVTSLKISTYF